MSEQIHATCLDMGGIGILLTGPSGCGKSDLALRMINIGARLVADDRVDIRREKERLIAVAPCALKDLIEVRGVGIINLGALPSTNIRLVFKLVEPDQIERLPEEETELFLDLRLPVMKITPFEISATQKVQLAVDIISGAIMRHDD